MNPRNDINKLFVELNDCLNALHKKGKKISYPGIAEELGLSIQRVEKKFEPLAIYIKTMQNLDRAEEAREAGEAQGFTLQTLPDQVEGETVPLTWKCSEGHTFTRTSNTMKFTNVLCPECKKVHGTKYKNNKEQIWIIRKN